MAITPRRDKDAIQSILDNDAFIERAGFKSENIRTTGASSDIINTKDPEFQIFIESGSPEGGSEITKNLVYVITVSGKRANSQRIDEVCEQIIALLDRKELGAGHYLYLLDAPMELASDPAVYLVETTFLCQCTNFNVVRK